MPLKTSLLLIFVLGFLGCFAQADSNKVFLGSKGTWEYPLKNRYQLSNNTCANIVFNHATFYTGHSEPIRALMAGTVLAKVKIDSMYLVIVKYGDYFLAYSNLHESSVKKWDYIQQGQIIGLPAKDFLLEDKYYVEIYLSKGDETIDLTKSEWFRKECTSETLPGLIL